MTKTRTYVTPLQRQSRRKAEQPAACQYMLLCEEPATTTVPNPILGDVPACERCAARYARLS